MNRVSRTSTSLDWQKYKYKLMLPYALAFVLVAGVGYQLSTNLFAESVTVGTTEITTDKSTYHVGDEIRFTITNKTPGIVTVLNNCPGEPLEVYRQVNGQWQQIHDTVPYSAKCDGEPRQYAIKPDGGTVTATYRFWDHLFTEAGRYRIIAPLQGVQDRPQTEFYVVGSAE